MVHNLSENKSIAQKIVYELRSLKVQGDRWRFRKNLERLSEIMAYEISKTFDYVSVEAETSLGVANALVPRDEIVLASILRAGLPMHQGFLNIFDDADNAFVSAYRAHNKDGSFEIDLQYVTCPNLEDKVLILIDPMLATGSSIVKTLERLEEYGQYKTLHIATTIASVQGINHVQRFYPKAILWSGAIDDELTAKSYIVPGLGDAGDLAYGKKLQE